MNILDKLTSSQRRLTIARTDDLIDQVRVAIKNQLDEELHAKFHWKVVDSTEQLYAACHKHNVGLDVIAAAYRTAGHVKMARELTEWLSE